MCFERLYDSMKNKELLLVDNGMCNYHLRKDGQLTIHEIISTKPGAGKRMLEVLLSIPAKCIVAKCPIDLPSNNWYLKNKFILIDCVKTKTGKEINVWKLNLEQ